MTSPFADPYELCAHVRDEIIAALVACGRPVSTDYVAAGVIAWDDCCGTLTVAPERVYQSAIFPNEGPDPTGCYTGSLAVTLLISLVRCVPVVDDQGNAPTEDAIEAGFHAVMRDAATVWNAVYGLDLQMALLVQTYTGAEGGCISSETRVTVGLDCELWAPCPTPLPGP